MRQYEIHSEVRQPQPTAIRRATLTVPELPSWLGQTFGAVAQALAAHGAGPAGPPFARYHKLGDDQFTVEAGFPAAAAIEPTGDVIPSALPGGQVAVTVHVGPYEAMEPAYRALASWVTGHGAELAGDAWEVYFSDPAAQPDPATWRTEVVQPYLPGRSLR